jgi:SAM-dependent methyltransferase
LGLFDFLKKDGAKEAPAQEAAKQPSHPMLELVLEQLGVAEDDVVLHLGFGTDLEPMMRMVPLLDRGRLAGVESSPVARERAARVFDEEFSSFKADFRDAVASKLPFYDGSFTKVLSLDQMHSWVNLDKAFDEVHRVLAPGGTFVLVWSERPGRPARKPEEVDKLLKSAGFYHPQLRERPEIQGHYYLYSSKKP